MISENWIAKIQKMSQNVCHLKCCNDYLFSAAALIALERRLGSMESGPDSFQQKMIDSNLVTLQLAAKLFFSLPFYKLFPTPTWKKQEQAENTFFRYQNIYVTMLNFRSVYFHYYENMFMG